MLSGFDLQVGDTLPTSWNNPDYYHNTVVTVDSILVGTEIRARYELNGGGAQYLVEGVGTSNGLFEPVNNINCVHSLDCFGLDAQGYYPTTDSGACDLPMSVHERFRTASLSIAPVPTSDRVTLRGAQGREAYTIYDPWGRAVLRGKTRQGETVIDLSALPNGMYSVVIGRSVLRVIVMRG